MINTENLKYVESGAEFVGSLSYDDASAEPRPGILVLPTFKGLTAFETGKAERLAELGYAALAVDMYGGGRSADDPDEARLLMNKLNGDRRLLLRRIEAAFAALKSSALVDPLRTAAIGFCFGGKCVLDLARSGADMRGVVSFHGVYDKPPFEQKSAFKASALILHGWEDPIANPEQMTALADELTERRADWQIVAYGNTGHAFTNPAAASPETGLFYKESTDRRSWRAMRGFLEEILA